MSNRPPIGPQRPVNTKIPASARSRAWPSAGAPNKVMVFAVKPSVIGLRHPIDGPLKPEGSLWELDGFTARMLTDGLVTREP